MTLESEIKKEIRSTKMKRAILQTVYAAGTLTIALMAPNVLTVLGKAQKRIEMQSMRNSVQRLIDKGLLKKSAAGLTLTANGEKFLQRSVDSLPRPKYWDKKWRIVIFDIQESRKRLRAQLRETLVRIGFKRLQNSVWVYPYDCEELITLLKTDYRIGKEVLYVIADKIEGDGALKQAFDL